MKTDISARNTRSSKRKKTVVEITENPDGTLHVRAFPDGDALAEVEA